MTRKCDDAVDPSSMIVCMSTCQLSTHGVLTVITVLRASFTVRYKSHPTVTPSVRSKLRNVSDEDLLTMREAERVHTNVRSAKRDSARLRVLH